MQPLSKSDPKGNACRRSSIIFQPVNDLLKDPAFFEEKRCNNALTRSLCTQPVLCLEHQRVLRVYSRYRIPAFNAHSSLSPLPQFSTGETERWVDELIERKDSAGN